MSKPDDMGLSVEQYGLFAKLFRNMQKEIYEDTKGWASDVIAWPSDEQVKLIYEICRLHEINDPDNPFNHHHVDKVDLQQLCRDLAIDDSEVDKLFGGLWGFSIRRDLRPEPFIIYSPDASYGSAITLFRRIRYGEIPVGNTTDSGRKVDESGWLSDQVMDMGNGWLLAGPLTPFNHEWSQTLAGQACLFCDKSKTGFGATAAVKGGNQIFAVCSDCMAGQSPDAINRALNDSNV